MPEIDSVISVKCSELGRDLFPEVVPPKVTPSFELFQLGVLCFIVNWAIDKNIYIATVMVSMVGKILYSWGSDLNDHRIYFLKWSLQK